MRCVAGVFVEPVHPSSRTAVRDPSPLNSLAELFIQKIVPSILPTLLFITTEISSQPRILRENISSIINFISIHSHPLPKKRNITGKYYSGYGLYWLFSSGYRWHLLKNWNVIMVFGYTVEQYNQVIQYTGPAASIPGANLAYSSVLSSDLTY